jgi:hypothetical protein
MADEETQEVDEVEPLGENEKIIKVRLFTWFENVDSPVEPGTEVRTERISHFGERVEINDEASLQRGEEFDAFFTDEEADDIINGTYKGPLADHLANLGTHGTGVTPVLAAEGEHGDASSMSTEEMADYIKENRLNVSDTVALAGDDEDSINKVLDAENIATGNDPRKGVVDHLEAKLAAAAQA